MTNFPIQPEGNRLIVNPYKRKEEKLKSLIIAATVNAELEVGEVIVAGKNTSFQSGDIVTYPAKSGLGQFIGGNPCLWLTDTEIWGVWSKEEWAKLNAEK